MSSHLLREDPHGSVRVRVDDYDAADAFVDELLDDGLELILRHGGDALPRGHHKRRNGRHLFSSLLFSVRVVFLFSSSCTEFRVSFHHRARRVCCVVVSCFLSVQVHARRETPAVRRVCAVWGEGRGRTYRK